MKRCVAWHAGHLIRSSSRYKNLSTAVYLRSRQHWFRCRNGFLCATSSRALSIGTISDDLSEGEDDDHAPETGRTKTVEEQYSRKTPLEHVLLRPSMYVGPTERLPPSPLWVLADDEELRMEQREYGLVPALTKVFDEILVNASDNRLRHPKTCTELDVNIDRGDADRSACISIRNNGPGIPIQMHADENMYVPELLFGHLLTGSNFDDEEKRLTGGRHGYGAKLANIFSKRFTVETVDEKSKLRYRQTWYDNMSRSDPPDISKLDKSATGYTLIEFEPDLDRLTQKSSTIIDEGDYNYMCRRVVDIAGGGGKNFTVTLNGRDVSLDTFGQYCQLYRDGDSIVYQRINGRWKVAVGRADQPHVASFVNGVHTSRGGTHVNLILQQITKKIMEKLESKSPELAKLVSPSLIRRHLFLGCDARIENPTFDSQMKECLTSNPSTFGSTCTLSPAFLNKLTKSETTGGLGIMEVLLRAAEGRQQANLLKHSGSNITRRQILNIPKLDDAHLAGTPGEFTTIILTEGDSAKTLAVAGLEIVGRDRFGVFPLRGKFLNVRDASVTQLTKNEEVKALIAILGLDFEKSYKTKAERQELRYRRVLLMTDQDTDGSHIKGLVINFFRHFWPALLQPPCDAAHDMPFLASFVTPLLKASNKAKRKEVLAFYSAGEFNAWANSQEDPKQWSIKYYKGLGTSTPAEAKEYFSAFDQNLRPYRWKSKHDGEQLDMVFDKKRAADRRKWILDHYDSGSSIEVDPSAGNVVSFEDFINKEMIHFSNADNIRSIPSVIDGLKPSQRKVLFACFKRKLKNEIKVAQLTGYCAEHTAYHHGEASLQATIIGMAQDFVGSNNINLLVPSGQFGTRLAGGTDAASPRYIFTHLAPIARKLFPEEDDVLLTYREDDGQSIEPEYFCPIIPMLLVNGTSGIGTGWSTHVPPHNPLDVFEYVEARLNGDQDLPPIRPYARGFSGTIELSNVKNAYITTGRATKKNKKSVLIDELPLRCWTNSYKDTLLKMRSKGLISSFVENHTTSKVSFTVNLQPAKISRMEKTGLEVGLKLRSSLPLGNMHAFDEHGVMQGYSRPEDIVEAYLPVRLSLYEDRKSVLESEATHAAALFQTKAKFIELVTSGQVDLASGRKTKDETVSVLQQFGLATHTQLQALRNNNCIFKRRGGEDANVAKGAGESEDNTSYDYLLNMPLASLSSEKIASLKRDVAAKEKELSSIQQTSARDLWRKDLSALKRFLSPEKGTP